MGQSNLGMGLKQNTTGIGLGQNTGIGLGQTTLGMGLGQQGIIVAS